MKRKQQQRSKGAAPGQGGDKPPGLTNTTDEESSPHTGFAISISIGSGLAGLPSMLHWIFLLLGTPTLIFLSICTPPFQTPDELAHFERAYQISRGGLYGGSGGYVDQGIDQAYSHYSQLPFNGKARVTAADEAAAASVQWTGQTVYRDFPNTATYPPIGYLPQALGIVLGRIAGLSVVYTLILSRLINGAFAILISVLALYWCQRGKLVMFAVLLLPLTISLFGSCSQDATLISISCLAFAIVSRQISEGFPLSLRMTMVLAAALLIVLLKRPPYVPLLLVLLIPGILPRWGKKPAWLPGLSLAGLLAALTVIWWLAAPSSANAGANSGVDAKMQLLYLFHHPGVLPKIMIGIDYRSFTDGFIGVLGWLDTFMPRPYYVMMQLMLLVAIIAEMVYRSRFKYSATAIILFAALSSVVGVVLIEYLLFNPVGSHIVEGVQSRYLIPLAIAGSIGLPRLIRSDRGYWLGTAVVVLCQLITFFYLPKVIIERYYLMTDQPNFIRERLYFADALQAQGKFDAAAQEYHQVIAVEPDNYNAHNGLGNVFDAQGSTQDALNEFQLSLAIKPDQAIAHSKMGRIFGEMHKFPESVEELTLALRYNPANAYAHNDLGVALYQMGDYEKAAEQFGEALRLDPSFAGARQNLNVAQAQLKNKKVQNGRK
jgi:uncharacterized membrane protein/Tfp pilus assembly protein PilF